MTFTTLRSYREPQLTKVFSPGRRLYIRAGESLKFETHCRIPRNAYSALPPAQFTITPDGPVAGEVTITVHNHTKKQQIIPRNSVIAKLSLIPGTYRKLTPPGQGERGTRRG